MSISTLSLSPSQASQEQQQALKAAGQWYAQLCSGNASTKDEQALQVWLDSSEINIWAWSRVDQLQQRLDSIPSTLALKTLERSDQHFSASRRNALKSIVLLSGTGFLTWQGYRQGTFEPLLADHHTATGEVKNLILADGSTLILNTASSVDVQFTPTERRIILRQGEIMVKTAKDLNQANSIQNNSGVFRPFIVQTAHGNVRALGTRFSVRENNTQGQNDTQVKVYQHSVEITTPKGRQQLCEAGQSVGFNTQNISQPANFSSQQNHSDAWTKNLLIVENMPLDNFVAELNRYRSGVMRCDPKVAHYRISGTFKTTDTNQALRAVEKSFPVTVNYRSRYWVSVGL